MTYIWLTDEQTDLLLSTLRSLRDFPGNDKEKWLKSVIINLEKSRLSQKGFPKIVCLSGSRRFLREYRECEKNFTLDGYIVLAPNFYPMANPEVVLSDEAREDLTNLYNRKIDLCDELFVINKYGYVGDRTKAKILYAHALGKKIAFYDNDNIPQWFTDLDHALEI